MRLAGSVETSDGAPAAGIDVVLYRAEPIAHEAEPVHWATTDPDGRFSLDPFLYFFTDDGGDNAPLHVGAVAIYDGVLTPAEVAGLGGPGGSIPEPSAVLLLAFAGLLGLRRHRR